MFRPELQMRNHYISNSLKRIIFLLEDNITNDIFLDVIVKWTNGTNMSVYTRQYLFVQTLHKLETNYTKYYKKVYKIQSVFLLEYHIKNKLLRSKKSINKIIN